MPPQAPPKLREPLQPFKSSQRAAVQDVQLAVGELYTTTLEPEHLNIAFSSAQCRLDCAVALPVELSSTEDRKGFSCADPQRNPIFRCPPLRCLPLGPPEQC